MGGGERSFIDNQEVRERKGAGLLQKQSSGKPRSLFSLPLSGSGLGREHGPGPGLVAAWAGVLLIRQATAPAPVRGRREGIRGPQARLVCAWRKS